MDNTKSPQQALEIIVSDVEIQNQFLKLMALNVEERKKTKKEIDAIVKKVSDTVIGILTLKYGCNHHDEDSIKTILNYCSDYYNRKFSKQEIIASQRILKIVK